ncbi:SRPBCC family protein [Ktedonobacter robiniae]|uniref:Activator of Hsp90 ATPase homologue 1/2-like C-terminal domain-containing protein n=1 Tax=Ktedonobacter robiniae TaxID=2778365 RepID=A0ABQ3V5Z7_9CHLR|nr:SRPBCC domain-containing protein [Ktedonobacter robiniae]GHO60012.1 hypothetical protein KSB_84870 [Ktedonobacter robiniae]
MAVKGAIENTGDMDVVDSLNVHLEITIAASPQKVFEALTTDIAAWWGSPFIKRRDANTIVLEPKVGGRLYEVYGENEGALWGMVSSIRNDEELCLTGSMGMPEPTYGAVTFTLAPQGDSTQVKLTHSAFGRISAERKGCYTEGWKDLLDVRLRAFVEQDVRTGIDARSA